MIICIGPFCVPIWHLGVLALILLQPFLDFFRRLWGRRNTEDETITAETQSDTTGSTYPSRKDNEPYKSTVEKGVTPIKSEADFEKLKSKAEAESAPLFVDFGATWCGPCRRMAPVFERLARSYAGVFASVDVDDCPDFPDLPPALPTFKVYRPNEGVIDTLTGANQEKLEALIAKHALLLR